MPRRSTRRSPRTSPVIRSGPSPPPDPADPSRIARLARFNSATGHARLLPAMARVITVGAAQLGPIARSERRGDVVKRLLALLAQAHSRGCDLVVFPELALTTFFPRWWMEDEAEIDAFFEREMPGPETKPLFYEARRLGLGFVLGYAELTERADGVHRFNTAILVERDGRIVGKYRKIH